MAGTTFEEIYDYFMTLITDYRLITLFNSSQANFNTYLSGWLLQAIPEFTNCDQSLANATSTFTETLTQKNINILAMLMKKIWLEKEIDNILQMNNLVQDRDFKTFSQGQNMKAKQERYVLMKEEVSQRLVEYGLNNSVDWQAWFNGTYYVP
jgi:hypothetical protein